MITVETPALVPTKADQRIQALDVARGLALFGIFMVNIQLMVQPLQWIFNGGGKNEGPLAFAFHYITRVFFESKSYPLFSMLFGMGLVLMYDRAKARGKLFATVYLRRLTILLLFGMAHAFLLWYGDILIYYACFGAVVMWLARLKPRTMLIIASALVVVSAIWASGLGYFFAKLGENADKPAQVQVEGFEGFRTALFEGKIQDGPANIAWATGETDAIKHGPFINAVTMRAINWTSGTIFWMFIYAVFLHVPAMFLLGGAIMRSGVMDNPDSPWPRRLMLIGLLVGLPGSVLAVYMSEVRGPNSPIAGLSAGVVHLFGPMLSLGYVGLAVWLAKLKLGAWLIAAVASAGRMALTNYICQSLLVAAYAQHWGMATFGEVSRVGMVVIVTSIYAFQLVFSTIWLRYFTMGPLEYLWRAATYLRLPKLRAPSKVAVG